PTAKTRIAKPSDSASIATLYAAPSPWLIKDYGERLYSTPQSDAKRYASVPASLFLRVEQHNGHLWLLENSEGHVVGSANLLAVDSTLQQHIYLFDFLVHPASLTHAPLLLDSV